MGATSDALGRADQTLCAFPTRCVFLFRRRVMRCSMRGEKAMAISKVHQTPVRKKVARATPLRGDSKPSMVIDVEEEIPGIFVKSPDSEWTGELLVRVYDWAENHQQTTHLFFVGDKAMFVSDKMLAKGEKEVLRQLVAEANRLWSWHREDGTALGRVPTGFEINLSIASSVLCALYAQKPRATQ
jgi:hypothetical protein